MPETRIERGRVGGRSVRWTAAAAVAMVLILAGAAILPRLSWLLVARRAEQRPALLEDAHWNAPASAQHFNGRFARGTSERALLEWLSAEHFVIDPAHRRATRLIKGFPCHENIGVGWTLRGEKLENADAVVRETACL